MKSDIPASLRDIPKTLMGMLELESSFQGVDLFSDQIAKSRTRIFADYFVGPDPFSEDNWTKSDSDPALQVALEDIPALVPGDTVSFAAEGIGHKYRGEGWFHTNFSATAAYYPTAELNLKLGSTERGRPKKITFDVTFARLGIKPLSYSINDGGTRPVTFESRSGNSAKFSIPVNEIAPNQRFTIQFHFSESSNDPKLTAAKIGFFMTRMAVN